MGCSSATHQTCLMHVLIVEDEPIAQEALVASIRRIRSNYTISAILDSVHSTVEWLRVHHVDLIFLDIHLSDGKSFEIFDEIQTNIPIIFTTAYDQYAIQAFSVNSLDYLLKPVNDADMIRAIEKYERISKKDSPNWESLKTLLAKPVPEYRQRFLVRKNDQIVSVKEEDIAYFEAQDRYVFLVRHDGKRFFADDKLGNLEKMLNPHAFFRLNRSFLARFEAIDQILTLSKSRLSVKLRPQTSRDIIVSTENTRLFKEWLSR